MDDQVSAADEVVIVALRRHVAGAIPERNVAAVSARAISPSRYRSRWARLLAAQGRPLSAVLAVVVVAIVGATAGFGIVGLGQDGSRPASAVVSGLDYTVSFARSFSIKPSLLSSYGQAGRLDTGFTFRDKTAFAIAGIDPKLALVLQLKSGQSDDSGPVGEYVLLIRGPDTFRMLCPYFDRTSEATPAVCR